MRASSWMVNSMAMASIISLTPASYTKASSSSIIWKEKASWYGQMSHDMRAISRPEREMEKALNISPTAIIMSDSGRMIYSTVQESCIMLKNKPRGKESGRMEKGTLG